MRDLGKFKGCLLGGAAGEALGYAVEFKTLDEIKKKYGDNGITRFEFKEGKALISDATQMSMFTANGLLFGATRQNLMGITAPISHYIHKAYKDWFRTQIPSLIEDNDIISWIYHLKQLQSRRAPGNTNLYALSSGIMGTLENRLNSSKGCGAMIRVAPIGLFFDKDEYGTERIDLMGAKAAAITHGHPLAFVTAAAFTHIINNAAYTDENLYNIVYDCLDTLEGTKVTYPETAELIDIIEKAVRLAGREIEDSEAIRRLRGKTYLAHETLAIAIYCALKYQNSFEKAIIASVNHSGGSNVTGAVTGNIMGAYLGKEAIPAHFLYNLELRAEIEELASDLFTGCPDNAESDEKWVRKYIKCNKRYLI